jgi:hypothetical protein
MWKIILGFLKPVVAGLISNLQTNQTANVATIEAAAQGGGSTVEAAVTGFLANEAKKVPELALFVPIVEPALMTEISNLVSQGTNTVPELYAAGLAFLEKEESEV